MSRLPWHDELSAAIAERKAADRYRSLRQRDGAQGVEIVLDGKKLLSFCSNDYLGLADHPHIKTAFQHAIDDEGVGSGAAHLLTGHGRYHQQLEQALAEFTGLPRVLLFSTGYMANLAVIDGLLTRGDVVIQDKWNHASLLDGGRLSDAEQVRYSHLDMTALARRLQKAEQQPHKLVVTDGVFSMDGDLAPLPEMIDLAAQYQAGLVIDDAHGFGVLGQHGRGSLEHWQIDTEKAPIMMGTFGKAFGTAGAFVAADELTIETLIQQARTYVYTTAQPGAVAAATLASLQLVEQESWRREHLHNLIGRFREGAQQLGLNLMESITPIQPVIIGDDKAVVELGHKLEQQGILVGVIRPPTIPQGTARLRITLSAAHSEQHVDQLLVALESCHVH